MTLQDEIVLVPFESRDIEAVLAIENQVYALPWSRESYEELLLLDSIRMWIAKEGERLVGYMLYQIGGSEVELHTIAVDPTKQGSGIGRGLMEHFIREAKKLQATILFLQVRPSNQRAISLYRKFGFEVVGVRGNYYTDNQEDAWVMKAVIGDPD